MAANPLAGQDSARHERGTSSRAVTVSSPVATAVATRRAPTIDGRPDDEVWQGTPTLDHLLEYAPRQDAESRFRTEVRFAYDRTTLFILARMYDPAPDSIVDRLGRRDAEYPADWIGFTIDGYHDRRTAHEFRVSAGGGMLDALVTRDGFTSVDASWDAVWNASVRADRDGWTAELAIPFSQLRYTSTAPVFGLIVRRTIGRDDAQLAWPRIDFNRTSLAWVSQGGDLTGFDGISSSAPLEVSPYVVASNQTRASGTSFTHPSASSAGFDIRYRFTPNLTLTGTVNPDFGQVEADPAQLNLSSFELFYPERRPFFLEGSSTFSFLAWCDDAAGEACKSPFYSRRVGRAPQLAGRFGDAASPLSARIDGALKLVGRAGGGLSLGILGAQTRREEGPSDRTIEPRARFLVARARQELFGQKGDVGGVLTFVDRDVDDWSAPYLRRRALVVGADGRRRFGEGLELQASLLHSTVSGSASAMTRTQRDAVHQYQQPGDALEVDTTRTSLAGESARLALIRSTGRLSYELSYQLTTPGFEMNDLGYQQRADRQYARAWFEWLSRPTDRWYRSRRMGIFSQLPFTSAGVPIAGTSQPISNIFTPYVVTVLQNTSEVMLQAWVLSPNRGLDDRVTRGGPRLPLEPALGIWGLFRTDARRNVIGELSAGRWKFDAGRSNMLYGHASVTLRPLPTLQASLYTFVQHFGWDQMWHSNQTQEGTDTLVYTFAHLKSTIVDPQVRIDWTLSPRTTLQFYTQPYSTSGVFSGHRALSRPGASSYVDRWTPLEDDPGGIDLQQLTVNTVWRWEYRPGSTLYLVWQQRREGATDVATPFNWSREMRTLGGLHPLNTFLLKMSYWINPR